MRLFKRRKAVQLTDERASAELTVVIGKYKDWTEENSKNTEQRR